LPAQFLSHPRARASLLLATSNTLSPNTDIFSVCDVSCLALARTHTRARAKPTHTRTRAKLTQLAFGLGRNCSFNT
jgi:hypothetical protein